MIANYRCQAELSSVESTQDGKALVLGTVDGCVSVLAILDPQKQDMVKYLAGMPSRDEEVSAQHKKSTYLNTTDRLYAFFPKARYQTISQSIAKLFPEIKASALRRRIIRHIKLTSNFTRTCGINSTVFSTKLTLKNFIGYRTQPSKLTNAYTST